MRVLSGIQPTGRFHWGNYFGAIRQYISLQGHEQSFYFIADLHALTTLRNPRLLAENVRDAAIDLLALGLQPERATLFRQSDVPEVTELTWLLMTMTQMHILEKCHAFKDKKANGLEADAGLFTYPVLMAADILIYDSDLVPVGVDQVQHIEVTRDLAQRFNLIYGATLQLPEAHVLDSSARVVGTDGQKMSKSYGNTIPVFESPTRMRELIRRIANGSANTRLPRDLMNCTIFQLLRFLTTEQQQEQLADRYRNGSVTEEEGQEKLFEAAMEYFGPAFERRLQLELRPDDVEDILRQGAARARAKARAVLARVRDACGLSARPV